MGPEGAANALSEASFAQMIRETRALSALGVRLRISRICRLRSAFASVKSFMRVLYHFIV
jgi:hypothetical protein